MCSIAQPRSLSRMTSASLSRTSSLSSVLTIDEAALLQEIEEIAAEAASDEATSPAEAPAEATSPPETDRPAEETTFLAGNPLTASALKEHDVLLSSFFIRDPSEPPGSDVDSDTDTVVPATDVEMRDDTPGIVPKGDSAPAPCTRSRTRSRTRPLAPVRSARTLAQTSAARPLAKTPSLIPPLKDPVAQEALKALQAEEDATQAAQPLRSQRSRMLRRHSSRWRPYPKALCREDTVILEQGSRDHASEADDGASDAYDYGDSYHRSLQSIE